MLYFAIFHNIALSKLSLGAEVTIYPNKRDEVDSALLSASGHPEADDKVFETLQQIGEMQRKGELPSQRKKP